MDTLPQIVVWITLLTPVNEPPPAPATLADARRRVAFLKPGMSEAEAGRVLDLVGRRPVTDDPGLHGRSQSWELARTATRRPEGMWRGTGGVASAADVRTWPKPVRLSLGWVNEPAAGGGFMPRLATAGLWDGDRYVVRVPAVEKGLPQPAANKSGFGGGGRGRPPR